MLSKNRGADLTRSERALFVRWMLEEKPFTVSFPMTENGEKEMQSAKGLLNKGYIRMINIGHNSPIVYRIELLR